MCKRATTPPVRVLIADDHRLFAEALEAVLATEERIEVVGRAADGEEAVELARRLQPDVVALDISMPVMDGFEAAAQLEPARASAGRADADRVERARGRRAGPPVGVKGYITKDTIAASLVDAILTPRRASAAYVRYPFRPMLPVAAVFQVLVSVALLALILMHSGRDAGLGGMGFTPASQGARTSSSGT